MDYGVLLILVHYGPEILIRAGSLHILHKFDDVICMNFQLLIYILVGYTYGSCV